MANTRPVTPVPGTTLVKAFDPRALDVLQQIAASTAAEAEGWAAASTLRRYLRDAAYADGVASVLAWLNGEPPSSELANLLELEDDQ